MTSDDEDESDDIDILQIAHDEAHRTVDNQIQTLDDIDAKAARILRLNIVLLGVILTGLSVASPAQGAGNAPVVYADFANSYSIAGICFLLLSTGVAAVTYTASSLTAGVGPNDLVQMVENDYTDTQNLEGLVSSYSNWVEYNYRVNAKNAPLGTLTLLLLIVAMASLSLGVKQALTGTVESWLLGIMILLLAAVVYLTGLIQQLQRWYRVRQE
ncbi:hypothetical protein [Haloarcula laminariae]|uniref:hypothetical protein n=1 Tax=Haloarcula laminariae TaxID=2961577 RepID=UPI002405B8D6|nr:hypothetical protein [Halomicroarcula sp. FL173]